ncbi:hypothetical protein Sjap_015527 [Stephania japonica]|uniref:Uncharacterized protein n=1 Tax=Stephania japonica TaxID=461633 RepID=A0AAP0IK29_9MAGN
MLSELSLFCFYVLTGWPETTVVGGAVGLTAALGGCFGDHAKPMMVSRNSPMGEVLFDQSMPRKPSQCWTGQLTLVNWSRVNCPGPLTGPQGRSGPWMSPGTVRPLVSNQGHDTPGGAGQKLPSAHTYLRGEEPLLLPPSPVGTTPKGPLHLPGAGELCRLSGQGRQVPASYGWAGARVFGEGGAPLSLSSRLAVTPLFLGGSNGDGGIVAGLAGDTRPCHPFSLSHYVQLSSLSEVVVTAPVGVEVGQKLPLSAVLLAGLLLWEVAGDHAKPMMVSRNSPMGPS